VDDKDFEAEFKAIKKVDAESFFVANLNRAKRFHEVLNAADGKSDDIEFYAIGSDCRAALDAVVIYQDVKTKKWNTLFQANDLTTSSGKKIPAEDVKKVMFTSGDRIVSKRSFAAETLSKVTGSSVFNSRSNHFICGEHDRLAANSRIQEYIIGLLSKPTETMIKEN